MERRWLWCCIAFALIASTYISAGYRPWTTNGARAPQPRADVKGTPSKREQSLARSLEGKYEESLCSPKETVIFQCSVGGKYAAVCAGKLSQIAYVQYRYGISRRLELTYPQQLAEGPGSLSWGQINYSGGGESQISFVNGPFQYVVYSRVVRTGFGQDGRNYPHEEAGVFVKKGTKMVSNRKCVYSKYFSDDVLWVDIEKAAKVLPESTVVEQDD